jgi:hypothetical protein
MVMKLDITNIQVALFSPGIDLSDKLALAQNIKKETGSLFNGESIVLPIPNDAPAEIPRIVLKNKNGQISLNISSNKVDIFLKPAPNTSIRQSYNEVKKEFEGLLKFLFKTGAFLTQRVGYVLHLQAKVDQAPKYIFDNYFKGTETKENWVDTNLGLLKRDTIDQKTSNIWFRMNPNKKSDGSVDPEKVIVMFDVNTLPIETNKFDVSGVLSYLKASSEYLDNYSKEVLK